MSANLDDALALIRRAVPTRQTATKEHHTSYRDCVLLIAADNPIPPERHAEFKEAVGMLGISPDVLAVDVAMVKEAARCSTLAGQLDALNQQARDVHAENVAFEEQVVQHRAELVAKRTAILTQIELANSAAAKVAGLSRNPRLGG